MSCYIFTVNDVAYDSNLVIDAKTIFEKLIYAKIWLFRQRAPYVGKLDKNDRVLIYLCGKGRRYFIAEIEVMNKVKPLDHKFRLLAKDLGLGWMTMYCNIELIAKFDKTIPINPLIDNLSFIVNKNNYGLNLRLPVIKIPLNDYLIITQKC